MATRQLVKRKSGKVEPGWNGRHFEGKGSRLGQFEGFVGRQAGAHGNTIFYETLKASTQRDAAAVDFGGQVRRSRMNPDPFRPTICEELGNPFREPQLDGRLGA